MRKVAYIGRRFGKLLVIADFPNAGKRTRWLCQCDCGKEKVTTTDNLRDGKTNSCGCGLLKEDLSGKRFGRLKILGYAGNERWECKCRCGKTTKVTRQCLIRKYTTSCGCLKVPNDIQYPKVLKKRILNSVDINPNGCWDWNKARNRQGYGAMSYRKKCGQRANRISYMVFKGDIPEGMLVCHTCNRTCCVNPDHLYLGTHTDNMNDLKRSRRT
jgi:HNH endonuclease